jgi:hypothetical protein
MLETFTLTPQIKEVKSIRPLELFYLFQKLYTRQEISVRIRKSEDPGFENPLTVIRASNSLIMLRDQVTGEVQFLSELKSVHEFVLDKDCLPYKANVTYKVA